MLRLELVFPWLVLFLGSKSAENIESVSDWPHNMKSEGLGFESKLCHLIAVMERQFSEPLISHLQNNGTRARYKIRFCKNYFVLTSI